MRPEPCNPLVRPVPLGAALDLLARPGSDPVAFGAAICDRIEQVEPRIRALVSEPARRQRLVGEARELASPSEPPHPHTPTPPHPYPSLHGALVGVKDIFRARGFETRAGSDLPPHLFEGEEALSVTRLRAAGALLLGKTVTTEFAYFEPGPTRNPWNPAHTPGGSSSGSAAAVAAGFCPLALGTQTVGSVIRPAAFCGIVGFKPTFGRISTAGVIPFAPSLDHVGLFTADAGGVARAAAVLCDGWTPAESAALPVLGVPEGPYLAQATGEGLEAFEEQLQRLSAAGCTIRRVAALADIEEVNARHLTIQAGEMARVHHEWFARYGDRYRRRTAEMVRRGQGIDDDALEAAREGQATLRPALERQMREAGIDLWVCPAATGPAPAGLDSTGDPAMNLPWTHAGLPAVTIPAGLSAAGLPLGLQCVAGWMQDERLLAWAERIEAALDSSYFPRPFK